MMDIAGRETICIWKVIGLVIAIFALGYKTVLTVYYYDSIVQEWGSFLFEYWALYLIGFLAVATFFTRGKLTLIFSGVIMSVSMLLICIDGIIWVAKQFDPSNRTMTEMGYSPLVHLLNTLAGALYLAGFFWIKRRERKNREKPMSQS